MKKLLIIFIIVLPFFSFSQEEQPAVKHHELKGNAFNLIVFKAVDFSYEYLIDAESSIGTSFFYNLKDNKQSVFEEVFDFYYHEELAVTTYYRHYFLDKNTSGFFLEAFGMYNVQEDFDDYYDDGYDGILYLDESSNNFAVGISVGGKFVSKNGFVVDIYGGIGRNIYSSNEEIATEVVRRVGASLGYRF